jgi:hypothetical protein
MVEFPAIYMGSMKGEIEIAHYFQNLGIFNPEDMAFIILTSYHRYLKHKELKTDELIEYVKTRSEEIIQREHIRKIYEINQFNVNDTVFFCSHNFISKDQENAFYNSLCIPKGLVLAKDTNSFLIKIRLVESCDPKGIIIQRFTHTKVDNEWIEKETIDILKEDEIKWTPYNIWKKHLLPTNAKNY